jgi:N utilization substance protein B
MEQLFRPRKNLRRTLREIALQILYAYEMNRDGREELAQELLQEIEDPAYREFIRQLIDRVIIHQTEYLEIIGGITNNWELSRIARIDKIILTLGLCELLYFPEIPPKVTLNEYIDIARDFSTDDSARFINGILDKAFNVLNEQGKIIKEGEGLIGFKD